MMILGYVLALLVGIIMGLIGGGGSILTLPILVYVMGISPVSGTAYSLFIVGTTALFAGLQNAYQKNVDFKTVIIFGIPSIISVYLTRKWLMPLIPDTIYSSDIYTLSKSTALMVLFACIMLLTAASMLRAKKDNRVKESTHRYNFPMIFLEGLFVGLVTGLVGAGGGFLIIPALVIFARVPMKLAIGTSLMIIATKSLIGFIGDIETQPVIEWTLLLGFSSISIIGSLLGNLLAKKTDNNKLKQYFAWFVLSMGLFILLKELLF